MQNLYNKLFSYVPKQKWGAYVSMLLAAASVFIFMASYWCLWKVFEEIIVLHHYDEALIYAIKVVILMIIRSATLFAGTLASHYLAFNLELSLRKAGLSKLMKASFSFFDTNNSGEIRRIIDDNASDTHKTVAHLIPDNITALLTPILMLVLMAFIDLRLMGLLILTTILGMFLFKAMSGAGTEFMGKYTKSLEEMSAATVEYVRGMQIIKIFGITVKYYKSLIKTIMDYKTYIYQHCLNCMNPWILFLVLFNIFYTVTIPFGICFMLKGEHVLLILTKIIFFSIFSGGLYSSLMSIMNMGMDNFNAGQAVEKLENLMSEMDKNKLEYGQETKMESFDIRFKDVDFKYEDRYILKGFNLELNENHVYALVGPSGGGKSTIAKLISGFYPVAAGEIQIGGKNISNYREDVLQKNIAFVFQNSKLFKKSILENVKIGNPSASYEEVMEALKIARCYSILDKFEDRENTVIGSKGVYLSGGEIQRIAIARAILKNSKIIIMDEASAATDPENEYELQQAFSELMRNKTVIMIAHRLSSIKNVDEILFVENGKVLEQGTHDKLMEIKNRYYDLQNLYARANKWRV